MRGSISAVLVAVLLVGCPRVFGREDGGAGNGAGYDPSAGNRFEGDVRLDDARVRALDGTSLRAGPTPCRAPLLGRVTRVTDGDTIHVVGEVPGNFEGRVRLIGVDTPEIGRGGAPSDCFADAAAAFTAHLRGRLVWLTFDAECHDRYNRTLAYVHVGGGDRDMWQRQLLRRGLAKVMTVGRNRAFSRTFESDQAVAKANGTGLWSACDWSVRSRQTGSTAAPTGARRGSPVLAPPDVRLRPPGRRD